MVLGKKGGLRSAVKQAGRQATKYAFTITSPSVSGLPERMESSGMILQFARGPKIAATAEADVPAERGPEGKLAWQGESLSFVATLYESKSQTEGKSFSDKRYRISLLGVRPAAFGTNKKATREVAYADVNVADFATCEAPTGKAVWMQVRGGRGGGVTAHFTIAARCVKRSGDGDDDDDDASISSAMTGFSAAPSGFSGDSERPDLEQNLDGFDDESSGRRPAAPGTAAGALAQAEALAAANPFAKRPPPAAAAAATAPAATWRAGQTSLQNGRLRDPSAPTTSFANATNDEPQGRAPSRRPQGLVGVHPRQTPRPYPGHRREAAARRVAARD